MNGVKLETRWNANWEEFKQDQGKDYDWVVLVESFACTRFDKAENVESKIANCKPYEVEVDTYENGVFTQKRARVIGNVERHLGEDFKRFIVSCDGVIDVGVHPDCIHPVVDKNIDEKPPLDSVISSSAAQVKQGCDVNKKEIRLEKF